MSTNGSTTRPPRLLQRVRDKIRVLHHSYRTEQAYTYWIRYFILFHGKKHPKDMGKSEVERFLTYLGSQKRVSASTQNQALSALLFLYKQVLELEIGWIEDVVRAKKSTRVPVVLTREEKRERNRFLENTEKKDDTTLSKYAYYSCFPFSRIMDYRTGNYTLVGTLLSPALGPVG